MRITSLQNPRVKAAVRLRQRSGRDEQGRIVIDGVREIGRALAAGVKVEELFFFPGLCSDEEPQRLLDSARTAGVDLIEVTPHLMEKLAFGQRVEGVVAAARPTKVTLDDLRLPKDALVAVVESIEKPGNLGAVLRTADAVGVAAVVVIDGGTDLYNPNAIRASLGAIFTVPICAASGEETLSMLQRERFSLFATRVDGAVEYTAADYRGRTALLLGSEAQGLSDRWNLADVTSVRLPMLGSVDSLNLSATAAVVFYEALRQRRGAASAAPGA